MGGETKCDTSESRWVTYSPSCCQDVLQVAHSSTDCPAWVCCIYMHGCAAANHKPAFSTKALNTQQRFINPNFPLEVKELYELYKLFLCFIYLLLIGQRMLLLPFIPSIHVGKSVLSSYTKRLAHSCFGFVFFFKKKKGPRNYLKKSTHKPTTNSHYKNNSVTEMKCLNVRNFWNELNVPIPIQLPHGQALWHSISYMSTYCCCTKLTLIAG